MDSNEIKAILSQKLSYLSRGTQSFVFETEDEQYVVKLFRYDRSFLKNPNNVQEKIEALFKACVLAYNRAKEETGVLYLHLNQTTGLPILNLKGPLGQRIRIPADDYRFVIQKKVEPFENALSKSPEQIKAKIDSFLRILENRVDKGITNLDPSLSRNFGFIDNQAFEIDFGSYSEGVLSVEKEKERYIKRLRSLLLKKAPNWVSYLDSATSSQ